MKMFRNVLNILDWQRAFPERFCVDKTMQQTNQQNK